MATDLTFNIAALDRASATFIKLAGNVDRVGERLDALERKRAEPKVDLDTSAFNRKLATAEKGIDAFSQRGQTQLIALGGALAAGAVSGAAFLAIPAAIVAIGVAAEKSNPQVQQSFADLTATAKETALDGFAPLVPALIKFSNQAKASLGEIKPELQSGATAAAPLLNILGTDFIKATQQGIGASVPIIQGLRPVAQAAGNDLIKVEQGVAGFLQNLDTHSAAQGLSTLGTDLQQLLPEVGQLVSELIPLGNALLGVAAPALKNTADAAEALAPVLGAVASAVSFLTPDFAAYAPVLAGTAVATKLLTGSWTDFGGAILRIKPLITDFGGAMDAVGQKLGFTTAATNQARAAEAAEVAVKADLAKASADVAVTEAEQAFAADVSEKNAIALVEAQNAQAAAADRAAAAEAALAATTEAASFSFGPLGIALGAIALLALPFITSTSEASQKTQDLTSDLVRLSQAAPSAASGILQSNQPLAQLVNEASSAGISVKGLLAAYSKGPDALKSFSDGLKEQHEKLGEVQIDQGKFQGSVKDVATALRGLKGEFDLLPPPVQKLVTEYNNQGTILGQLKTSTGELTEQQKAAAAVTSGSAAGQQQAASVARALGISVSEATAAYRELATGQTFAMSATQQNADAILGQVLAVDTANATVGNYFKQADQQLAQAQQAVTDASHSQQQAIDAVTDARHSFAQSEQAVADAEQGVVTAQRAVVTAQEGVVAAQQNVTKARQQSQQAQVALNQAEAQAVEQLKELHLQLQDQVVSEEQARVSLFDAQQSAAGLHVTSANAQQVANQKITKTNEDRVKAAIALLQAENQLNDTQNTGVNLRKQVQEADQAGVSGNPAVIQAKQALKNANDQIAAAQKAVLKAQQAVTDAQAGVVKAEQGVTEAVYNESKARDAIKQALYNEERAADAVKTAKQQLATAEDNASHSMDASTAAGQRNLGMLKQIADQLFANETPQKATNDLINDAAKLFGTSKDKAAAYLRQLGLIPKVKKFSVTAVGDVDLSKLPRGVQLRGTTGFITSHLATGGQVFGPGGPRDDKIPAMLSNREFVQPTDAVDYYGVGFMEAVRHKRLPKRFADGGLAEKNVALGILGVSYEDMSATTRVIGIKGFPPLPQYVPPAFNFGVAGLSGNRAANEALMKSIWASQFGWTGSEWAATQYLMMRESGFNNLAQNPTSTAFGQFQFLDSTWAGYGIPKTADPRLQDIAGGRYIKARYGDPIRAAAHERAFNWYSSGGLAVKPPKVYDSGGILGPGELAVNRGRKPEAVLTPEESAAFVQIAKSLGSGGEGKAPIEVHVHSVPGYSVDQIVSEVIRKLEFVSRG